MSRSILFLLFTLGTFASAALAADKPRIEELTASAKGRYAVKVQFPVLENASPFHAALNATLKAQAEKSFAKLKKEYREDSRKAAASPDEKSLLPYYYKEEASVTYADDTVISIRRDVEYYGGGAHPLGGFGSAIYAWENGQVTLLSPDKIFHPKCRDEINKLCIRDLKRQKAAWPDDAVKDPPIICLTSRGLLFLYPPYSAGPWVQGAFQVLLPFPAIKTYLNPNTPIAQLAQTAPAETKK